MSSPGEMWRKSRAPGRGRRSRSAAPATDDDIFAEFGHGPGSGRKYDPAALNKLHDDGRRKLERQHVRLAQDQKRMSFSPQINKTAYTADMKADVFSRLSQDRRGKRQEEVARRQAAVAEQERAKKMVPKKQAEEHAQRLYEQGKRKQRGRFEEPALDLECSFSPHLISQRAKGPPSPIKSNGDKGSEAWVNRLYDPERFDQKRKTKEEIKAARESRECSFQPTLVNTTYSPDAGSSKSVAGQGAPVHERLYKKHETIQKRLKEAKDKQDEGELVECSFQPFRLDNRPTQPEDEGEERRREQDIVKRLADVDVDRRRERQQIINDSLPRNCTFTPTRVAKDLAPEGDGEASVHDRLYSLGHERISKRNNPSPMDVFVADSISERHSATKPSGEWRTPKSTPRRGRRSRSMGPMEDTIATMTNGPLSTPSPNSGENRGASTTHVASPPANKSASSPFTRAHEPKTDMVTLEETAAVLQRAFRMTGHTFNEILKRCNCPAREPLGHSELQFLLRNGFNLSTTKLPFIAIKTLFKHLDNQVEGYGFTPDLLRDFIGLPEPDKVQPASPVPVGLGGPTSAKQADGIWMTPLTEEALQVANRRLNKAEASPSTHPTVNASGAVPVADDEAAAPTTDATDAASITRPQRKTPALKGAARAPPRPSATEVHEPPLPAAPASSATAAAPPPAEPAAPVVPPSPPESPSKLAETAEAVPASPPAAAVSPPPPEVSGPSVSSSATARVDTPIKQTPSAVTKMAASVMRPNAKGTGWVTRWLETGGTSKTGDVICCYTDEKKTNLLNAMKLRMASDIITLSPEEAMGEEGIFVIHVNDKEYPFKAASQKEAEKWTEFLNALRSNTEFSQRRGSTP